MGGVAAARDELARHAHPTISAMTWMEVLVGAAGNDDSARLRSFLNRFKRLPINDAVSEAAVRIRREHRIRLPDAIIWATALASDALLVTRNTRDFPENDPGVRVPYTL